MASQKPGLPALAGAQHCPGLPWAVDRPPQHPQPHAGSRREWAQSIGMTQLRRAQQSKGTTCSGGRPWCGLSKSQAWGKGLLQALGVGPRGSHSRAAVGPEVAPTHCHPGGH